MPDVKEKQHSNHYLDYKLKPESSTPITLNFVWFFSCKEICSKKCYFCLCLFSCLLVTIIALVSNTVLAEGPIIFVIMAENAVGETDITITPKPVKIDPTIDILDNMIFYSSLNYTHFTTIAKQGEIKNIEEYSTYRLDREGKAKPCSNCETTGARVLVINTSKEEKMSLGRNYSVTENKLINNQCIIHRSLAERMLNLNRTDRNSDDEVDENNYRFSNIQSLIKNITGKELQIELTLTNLLKNSLLKFYCSGENPSPDDLKRYNENLEKINQITNYNSTFTCVVKNVIKDNYGKIGDDRDTIFMESEYFFKSFITGVDKQIDEMFPDFKELFSKELIIQYADSIIVNFPKPRLDFYLENDFYVLLEKGVNYANKLFPNSDPPENFNIETPIITELQPLYYGAVFFGLILNLIVIILFALSIILIYSLLLITTETNTFDLALLRLIGNSKSSVVVIILTQCLSFSFPAFFIGYIFHFFLLAAISKAFTNLAGTEVKLSQDAFSIIYSFLLCNLAPIIASYFPIKSLMNKNLAESLNINQSKTSGVKVSIVSSVDREQKVLITFGVLTLVYGVSIYYFLPLSLLSLNLSLLLAIFLWILLGMFIGFILLTLNLEHIVQKLFTHIFLFWTKTYTRTLIIKNLIAHRLRNQKTSLMFSLSVGFFILISVGSKIEINSSILQNLRWVGARVHLRARGPYYLTADYLKESLNKMQNEGLIEDYGFLTPELSTLCDSNTEIVNIGKAVNYRTRFYGISPNFYNSTENAFLKIHDPGKNNKLKQKHHIPSQWLYSVENDGKIGISNFYTDEMDVNINDKFFLFNSNRKSGENMIFTFMPAYILSSSPAITMSSTGANAETARSLTIPLNIYGDILAKCSDYFFTSKIFQPKSLPYEMLPIDEVMIQPKDERESTIDRIKEIVTLDENIIVRTWTAADNAESMNKTRAFIELIFYFVALVILMFCFFNLTASMSVNMQEQQKELSIFRSLGLTKSWLKWIYVAEAFILIFAASFTGLIVGTILSWTMLLQRIVFTNISLTFEFPYIEMMFLIVLALIGGFFSTYFKIVKILKKQISTLMKN